MAMVEWAKSELDRLLVGDAEEDGMQKVMNDGILEMVEMFSNQGHSGFSAPYAISVLNRLLSWKPITPLTGADDEWNDISEASGGQSFQQNKRCSAVFRENNDNSTAYYMDGKVFSDDGGESWYSCRESRIPVVFPFDVPEKPEYIILRDSAIEPTE